MPLPNGKRMDMSRGKIGIMTTKKTYAPIIDGKISVVNQPKEEKREKDSDDTDSYGPKGSLFLSLHQ